MDVSAWLSDRRPPAPQGLRRAVEGALAGADDDRALLATLDVAARDRLDEARRRPGRVRESAFALLAADALVTYACEAALELEDPEAALEMLLAVGQAR